MTALPLGSLAMAVLYASGSRTSPSGSALNLHPMIS